MNIHLKGFEPHLDTRSLLRGAAFIEPNRSASHGIQEARALARLNYVERDSGYDGFRTGLEANPYPRSNALYDIYREAFFQEGADLFDLINAQERSGRNAQGR